jgi:AdoMet-dependent heme synthase
MHQHGTKPPSGRTGTAGHPGGHPHGAKKDGPPELRLIAWEVTRSCNLACKHCRAEAHTEPYPGELSTDEAKALIDTFSECGNPIVIFTGGEPLMRHDIFELVAYAKSKGHKCVMAPNGTLITQENARRIGEAGIERCSISIDGPDAASHDLFRGVPGAFEASLRGNRAPERAGIPFQINTTVTRNNLAQFKEIFHLAERLGAVAWHIFMLVPTGRAAELEGEIISAAEYEEVLNWFYDFRKTTSMHLKATCAPHYHRILRQRAREENIPVDFDHFGLDAVSRGCLGGIGFCFISHTGQVQPCGYLELDCGQIKEQPFPQIWEDSPRFRELRDKQCYTGKCGPCEYHRVCGGCRARAQTMRGDFLAEEPLCTHEPKKESSEQHTANRE